MSLRPSSRIDRRPHGEQSSRAAIEAAGKTSKKQKMKMLSINTKYFGNFLLNPLYLCLGPLEFDPSVERDWPRVRLNAGVSENDRIFFLNQHSLEELPMFLASPLFVPGSFAFAFKTLCCTRFLGRASGTSFCPAFPFRAFVRLAHLF